MVDMKARKDVTICDSPRDRFPSPNPFQSSSTLKTLTTKRRTSSRRTRQPIPAYDSASDFTAIKSWDMTTNRLVAASTIPLCLLLGPQLWMNYMNLRTGNAAALVALSWMAYLTGLGGNTLLLSYFTQKKETNAVLIQGIGIASNFAMLTQIHAAGFMPAAIYYVVAAVVTSTGCLTGLKIAGLLDANNTLQKLWTAWQTLLALVGLAVVPQVLCSTLGVLSPLPSIITLSLGLIFLALDFTNRLPGQLRDFWSKLNAWIATLLFMLQPVAALAKNFTDPSSLQGLSVTTIQLGMAGNALMVPRALWLQDVIWFTGSVWGSLFFGWAQLLSLYLGRSPVTGQRFLSPALLAVCTVLLLSWFAFVLVRDSAAKGYRRPLHSLKNMIRTQT